MLIIKVISIIGVVTNIYTGANYNCHVTNSSTGKTGYFCCDNHEEKDGKCIECKIGYKSIDGKPCVACPVDFYGQKCHARCSCQENERCHHVTGCTKQSVGLVNFSIEHGPDLKDVTEVQTNIYTWKIDETTNQVYKESHSKDIHIIILYTLLASAITICIAVVYFCSKGNTFGACKRPEEGHSQRQMQDQPHQLMQQNRSAEYIDVIDENTYESIEDVSTDDAAISGDANNIISVDNDQNSTSTNSNESARATDGSYLTSYEPLNDHIEKHDYKKIEPTVDIVFRREDTSSDSDKNSMDSSGYLKPVKIEDTDI